MFLKFEDFSKTVKLDESNAIQEEINVEALFDTLTEQEVQDADLYLGEGFEVTSDGIKGKTFFIKINGKEYGYTPAGGSIDDMARKFEKMLAISAGKAVAWLKKNSTLVQGSTQGGVPLGMKLQAAMMGESEEVFEGSMGALGDREKFIFTTGFHLAGDKKYKGSTEAAWADFQNAYDK